MGGHTTGKIDPDALRLESEDGQDDENVKAQHIFLFVFGVRTLLACYSVAIV